MSWQPLLAISIATYTVSVLLQRAILKDDKSDPIAYSIVFGILTGTLVGIYASYRGFQMPNVSQLWPNFLIMMLLYGSGSVFIFQALSKMGAGEFTIIYASRALFTIIGALFFLNEKLSVQQIMGTLLVISSIVIVNWQGKNFKLSKGLFYAILASVTIGLAFVNDAYVMNRYDAVSYLTIAFILPALAVWAVYPHSTSKMSPLLNMKMLLKLLIMSIFYAIAAITIFLAYQVGKNSAQIASINQISTILTVILSVIFLNERKDLLRKLFGSILSFIGVVALK